MNWKHGYFAESGYTYGYYVESSPARMRWLAALKGFTAPADQFRYLDLGCGQGLSLLCMAALHPHSSFVGIDFMPEHIAHARLLAERSGLTNVQFLEADFLQLEQDPAPLGSFHYVIAHGITTWIAPAVREALFAVAGRVLEPGGIFYNSYNTYPGWLAATPLQNLVLQMQRSRTGLDALKASETLLKSLQQAGSGLFSTLPGLEARLDALSQQDPSYLVQEYNNAYWQPVHSNVMLELAQVHKLSFLCSATIPEVFDGCYHPEAIALINAQADPLVRETVRDLALCQSFRRDLYIKGGNPLWPAEKLRSIQQQRFRASSLAQRPAAPDPFDFKAGSISVSGKHESYTALLAAFGSEGNSLEAVLAAMAPLSLGALLQMVGLLLQGGWLFLEGDASPASSPALNGAMAAAALQGAPYRYLCMPRLLSALSIDGTDMLLLGLLTTGTPASALAQQLPPAMAALNQRFAQQGVGITDPNQVAARAQELTTAFLQQRYPLYQALGAVA